MQKQPIGKEIHVVLSLVNYHQQLTFFFKLAQKGRYDQAVTQLNKIPSDTLRTLKNQQHWTFYLGLLKLRRQLHRYHPQRFHEWH